MQNVFEGKVIDYKYQVECRARNTRLEAIPALSLTAPWPNAMIPRWSARMFIQGNYPFSLVDFFYHHKPTLDYVPAEGFKFGNLSGESPFQTYLRHKTQTHLPWMSLNLSRLPEPFPAEAIFNEAKAIAHRAVPHRAEREDSRGWKSICLHGLSNEKTEGASRYGYPSELEAPYDWTPASELCPTTAAYFKYIFPHTRYNRLRFMYLEPGGYIAPHEDVIGEPPHFTAINIALNQPGECYFLMGNEYESSQQRWGFVPFRNGGDAFWLDLRNYHSVVNRSHETRIHIIVHSTLDPGAEHQIRKFNKILPRNVLESAGDIEKIETRNDTQEVWGLGRDVALALWNTNSKSNPSNVIRHYNDFSRRLLSCMRYSQDTPTIERMSADEIFNWATRQTQAKYLVVIASSSIIFQSEKFWSALHEMIEKTKDDTMVWGHIMDYGPERGVGLHEQMFVVDLEKYRQCGSGVFGLREHHSRVRKSWIASEEKMNAGYTPLFLKPADGEYTNAPRTYGWKLIDDCLRSGYWVRNLSEEIRQTKIFGYPEDNHHILEGFLGDKIIDKAIPFDQLEEGQAGYLKWVQRHIDEAKQYIWVYNNESWKPPELQLREEIFDGQVCPAAGALDFHYFKSLGQKKLKTIIYGVSEPALHFHKMLREKLTESKGIETIIAEYRLTHPKAKIMELSPKYIEQDFNRLAKDPLWKEYLATKREYVNCDILRDSKFIFQQTHGLRKLIVDISNIFNFLPWIWIHTEEEIWKAYRAFLRILVEQHPNSLLIGKSPAGEVLSYCRGEDELARLERERRFAHDNHVQLGEGFSPV